jgi:hypothetical protein
MDRKGRRQPRNLQKRNVIRLSFDLNIYNRRTGGARPRACDHRPVVTLAETRRARTECRRRTPPFRSVDVSGGVSRRSRHPTGTAIRCIVLRTVLRSCACRIIEGHRQVAEAPHLNGHRQHQHQRRPQQCQFGCGLSRRIAIAAAAWIILFRESQRFVTRSGAPLRLAIRSPTTYSYYSKWRRQ